MAVTKTHPIKSTLKAAIDYILNPEKDRREAACVLFRLRAVKPPILSLHGRGKLPEIAAHI